MGIITFLKELRKELLVKRLNKLNELAKHYSLSIDCYAKSTYSNNIASSKALYFLNSSFSSYCYTEEFTNKYDYLYSSYYKLLDKIEKLERRLQKL